MTPSSRTILACWLAALPMLAAGQAAMLRPDAIGPAAPATAAIKSDGQMRYALGAGASYLSASSANAATVNVGADSAFATTDTRWRFGGRALWSRTVGETAAENLSLLLVQESQHRWSGGTWLRQKLSVSAPMRSSDALRTTFETGLAIATSPFCKVNLGLLQHYDASAPVRKADAAFVTAIDFKLP